MAGLATRYGNGQLRTTVMQNLVVVNVPANKARELARELEAIGLPVEGSAFWRGAIACTGSEFCKLAITETKGFTRWIVDELEERLPGFDQQLKLHVTGCPNSCGQHWIADIGMEGKKIKHEGKLEDAYYFCVGGSVGLHQQSPGPSATAAWQPKCRMRWNACWAVTCRCASREKTCAPTLPGPAMSSCGSSWPAQCSRPYPGIPLQSGENTLTESAALFPLFLKLEGKRCLVVGAGLIGLEKVDSLLRCGASIRVVAPQAVVRVQELSAHGQISWLARPYEPADVTGCDLVIAASSDREVNRAVFEEATRQHILCNTADDPPLCDFFFASTVQRGDLQIAISTAGQSPALAQRLRREIDAQLPADLGPWVADSVSCGVRSCRRCRPGRRGRRFSTNWQIAKSVVYPRARRETSPTQKSSTRSRNEQG